MDKSQLLNHYYLLINYFRHVGRIMVEEHQVQNDFPRFFLHSIHMRTYDFVIPYCRGKKVLDIGCSLGTGEFVLADAAESIIAIDANEKALEFARRSIDKTNVEFMKADARELPFEDESFDIVIAFQLIEHIPPGEVGVFLSEVSRVLKSEGLCLIATPNRKFRLLPFQKPTFKEHYQEFTARNLRRNLKPVFKETQIRAISASGWLEEIEKRRSRQSPYEVYIKKPFLRLKKSIVRIKKKLMPRPVMASKKRPAVTQNVKSENGEEFKRLFERFEPSDIFLKDERLDKSMDLFAVCRK